MIALSVRQPWTWAILSVGKSIENRTWRTDYRGPLLLHAGATVDTSGIAWLREQGFVVPWCLPVSCYLGLVTVTGCRRCTVQERYRTGGNFWAFGPWCWELEEPRPFARPIPGPGRRGLYEVELPGMESAQPVLLEV